MYDRIFCDPLAWLNEGTVDYVSPQLYWPSDHETNPYEPLAQWWDKTARHFRRHCFPSHSLTNLASTPAHWQEQGLQIDIDRRAASPGSVLYSASSLTGKKAGGLASWLGNRQYLMPALMPPMEWKHAPNPGKISGLTLDGEMLRWKGNDAGRYVVYALPDDLTAEDVAADAPDRNYLPPTSPASPTSLNSPSPATSLKATAMPWPPTTATATNGPPPSSEYQKS